MGSHQLEAQADPAASGKHLAAPATVFVVDDDLAVRDALRVLLETSGYRVETHESAEAFLAAFAAFAADRAACLVLDVRLPRMSGPQLQQELARRGLQVPIVFLTAHGDIPMTVQAMKAGATDFLTKPVEGSRLIERVEAALAEARARGGEARAAQARLAALTERERQVMELAVAGLTNKDIAERLGISHRTVEVHRSHLMRKTGAAHLLELAHLAEAARGTARPH